MPTTVTYYAHDKSEDEASVMDSAGNRFTMFYQAVHLDVLERCRNQRGLSSSFQIFKSNLAQWTVLSARFPCETWKTNSRLQRCPRKGRDVSSALRENRQCEWLRLRWLGIFSERGVFLSNEE